MGLTIEKLHELIEDLKKEDKQNKNNRTNLPAYDYPEFTDEEFESLVTNPGYIFIGGTEMIKLFTDRCKKLNLL